MGRSRIPLSLVVVLTIAGSALADVPVEVRALEEAFARNCQAGDVEGVVGLYTDDAIVVWPAQGAEAKGKDAIRKLVTGLCKETKNLKLTIKSLEARSLGADNIAVIGHWDQSYTGPDGKQVVAEMRATEVLQRTGGKLLYLIDHGSIGLPPPAPAPAKPAAP